MGDRLEGKVAIITGGTSGIGYRTVEIFVEQGARVLIAARSEDVGQTLADRLGDSAFFVRTDVTQEDDIRAMIDAAMKRWGQIDCLFNNASGGTAFGPIDELAYTDFLAAMELQIGSVFLGTKYVTPGSHFASRTLPSCMGRLTSQAVPSHSMRGDGICFPLTISGPHAHRR